VIISNRNHGSDLPPSWRTLYQLTKVEDKKLIAAIKDGRARHPVISNANHGSDLQKV
jgi:hypothetical protein